MNAIVLDGWTVKVDAGEPRVRDLDLAEKAGLAKPRDIRATIRKAVEDGAISAANNGAAATGAVPTVWSETESVPRPKGGGMQEVEVFYLNEEAAMLVLTRLRTPAAVKATRALVMICAAARRGELGPAPAPTPAPPVRLLPEKTAICFEAARLLGEPNMVALFGPDLARTRAEHYIAEATGKEPQDVAPRMLTAEEYLRAAGMRPADARSRAPAFGKLVKGAYVRRHGKAPPMVDRQVDGATRMVCGYTEADRSLFEEAFALLAAPAKKAI